MAPVQTGRIVLFGAGGPIASAATEALAPFYTLRLTDVRPIGEIAAEASPQSPDAPLPRPLQPPHEMQVVDVTRFEQVLAATEGMDAVINLSVVRETPQAAFRVNMAGAYNVMKAAAACGVRRVIHTGPFHTELAHDSDYWYDFGVYDDVPLHPGANLYAISKMLGGEIVRVFAEHHGLETLVFLYCALRSHDWAPEAAGTGVYPFTISWRDAGAAFLAGLRAPAMPSLYEPFFICADLPHGKFKPEKAKRLLQWQARDRFDGLWQRADGNAAR